MRCAYIDDEHMSAGYNMGCDESILTHISKGIRGPTLRLYGWKPSAVSIGYFQSLSEEVNEKECINQGIDIVRRITGGGAVFHQQELTYSLCLPQELVSDDILKSYNWICSGVIEGFRLIGVEASFAPLNDIVSAEGKKLSGNAQTRRSGVCLQHGTILLSVDVERMFSILKVPNEKMKGKLIEDVKQRVTSVSEICDRDLEFNFVKEAFKRGFSNALDLDLFDDELSEEELAVADRLRLKKYEDDSWNRKR